MSFNLFDWIREGVKRSVVQGVAEALEAVGSPAGDDGPGRLAHLIPITEGPSSAISSTSKRKRLGRSLRDVEGGE
jgi:hypothetical protein